ncbi:inositol monophosphatase family protein [Sphingomonas beigongshangi]|jgi:fructose-1,6-bisphosphatase/inositol monophosphatase family enzyme|uniref:inositol monophosphatase family protein n=1 Tax=Sphingomonas beigongshangi TaxID=2782540 RepID=UPI001AED4B66|nr:inositol monophosphatase family protein [Sphingomonas beigongshangi]
MTHDHHDAVVALMRRVGADIVMPHFRNLSPDQVIEKAADDLVTVADRASEAALTEGLSAIDAHARVVGEEAVSADASLLEGLDHGRVWIVDPIDGTNNYASGRTPFGIMVALADDGMVEAGWILDPVSGRLVHAVAGGGAFVDGVQVTAHGSSGPQPVAGVASYFLSTEELADIDARAAGRWQIVPMPRCAAEQYPRLVLGDNDAALFRRTLPWDHAAGSLFLREAGGVVRRLGGADYRIGDGRSGMIAAASADLWEQALAILEG